MGSSFAISYKSDDKMPGLVTAPFARMFLYMKNISRKNVSGKQRGV